MILPIHPEKTAYLTVQSIALPIHPEKLSTLGTTMTENYLVAAVVPSIHHLILCYSLWLTLS